MAKKVKRAAKKTVKRVAAAPAPKQSGVDEEKWKLVIALALFAAIPLLYYMMAY